MNYAEYDNYGTITEFDKDKTIIYRPENEKQSQLFNDARMLNKSLLVEFNIYRFCLLFLLFLVMFIGICLSYFLKFDFIVYFKYATIIWLFCFIYCFYYLNQKNIKLDKLNERIKKKIPYEIKYN